MTETGVKDLGFEEYFCTRTQYELVAKCIETATRKIEFDLDQEPLEDLDDAEVVQEKGLVNKKKLEAKVAYLVERVALLYKARENDKITEAVLERVMRDEDKQYQLDIDDIIEEHFYQCV